MKKLLYTLLITACSLSVFAQQEAQYTMFMHNKQTLNPAYAGAEGVGSLTALYRSQWIGYDGAPQSALLNFQTPLLGDRIGFGLGISNHTIGIENTWYANMAYSYNVKISDTKSFRFGLQGSLRYLGLDFSDPAVIIRQSNDPSVLENENYQEYFGNFGVGLYLNLDEFYFGVSVPHLFQNDLGVNPSSVIAAVSEAHIYGMAGYNIKLNENFGIEPSILVKYVQNAPVDVDFNVMAHIAKTFDFGLSYRAGGDDNSFGESIDIIGIYNINSLSIGLAYDLSLSEIETYSSGSFEALVRFAFVKEREDMANPRFFNN